MGMGISMSMMIGATPVTNNVPPFSPSDLTDRVLQIQILSNDVFSDRSTTPVVTASVTDPVGSIVGAVGGVSVADDDAHRATLTDTGAGVLAVVDTSQCEYVVQTPFALTDEFCIYLAAYASATDIARLRVLGALGSGDPYIGWYSDGFFLVTGDSDSGVSIAYTGFTVGSNRVRVRRDAASHIWVRFGNGADNDLGLFAGTFTVNAILANYMDAGYGLYYVVVQSGVGVGSPSPTTDANMKAWEISQGYG